MALLYAVHTIASCYRKIMLSEVIVVRQGSLMIY